MLPPDGTLFAGGSSGEYIKKSEAKNNALRMRYMFEIVIPFPELCKIIFLLNHLSFQICKGLERKTLTRVGSRIPNAAAQSSSVAGWRQPVK